MSLILCYFFPVNDYLNDEGHNTNTRHKEDEGVEITVHNSDDRPPEPPKNKTDDRGNNEGFGRAWPNHAKKKHDAHDYKKWHKSCSFC